VKKEVGGANLLMTSPLFREEVGEIDDSLVDDLIGKLMNGESIEDFKFTRRQVNNGESIEDFKFTRRQVNYEWGIY
jgi:hypothetical protein